jgi:hypothetical protein
MDISSEFIDRLFIFDEKDGYFGFMEMISGDFKSKTKSKKNI